MHFAENRQLIFGVHWFEDIPWGRGVKRTDSPEDHCQSGVAPVADGDHLEPGRGHG